MTGRNTNGQVVDLADLAIMGMDNTTREAE